MVAGYQDDLDSEDEVVVPNASGITVAKTVITQDIDLSSDEDVDATHSNVHVVKYGDDYESSDEEVTQKTDHVDSAKLNVSDVRKTKSNSVSSGSDIDSRQGDVKSAINVSNAISNAKNSEVVDNDSESSVKAKPQNTLSTNSDLNKSKNVSSDSSASDHMTNSTNQNKATVRSTNDDSESDSDDGCQVTVLKDTDINPSDFGGEDVFNDWLNKQEVGKPSNLWRI